MLTHFRWRPIIFSVIGLGLIISLSYYLYANADKYLELMQVSSSSVFLIISITMGGTILNGIINTLLFQNLGTNLSYKDGFVLASASTLANQLPISGGMITRGYYLKLKHNLPFATYFSISLALFVCFIAVNGLIGLTVLIFRLLFEKILSSPYLWVGFALMLFGIVLFWLPLDRKRIPDRLHKWVLQAIDGWMFIGKNPLAAVKLIGLQTLMVLMLAARYHVAFHMLSQNVSATDALLFASASVLTQLVSIAPGGLGVTETIVAAVASALGFELGVSVVAVGLDRLISTVVILIVGGISTVILGKQLSDISLKPDGPA